jgi:hypothetical protein
VDWWIAEVVDGRPRLEPPFESLIVPHDERRRMVTVTPTLVAGVLLYPALILGVLYLVYRARSDDEADPATE